MHFPNINPDEFSKFQPNCVPSTTKPTPPYCVLEKVSLGISVPVPYPKLYLSPGKW